MFRSKSVPLVVAVVISMMISAVHAQNNPAPPVYRFAVLPDTQTQIRDVVPENVGLVSQMSDYIVQNYQSENYIGLLGVGDVVFWGGDIAEWNAFDTAMGPAMNVLPWAMCLGNHDYGNPVDPSQTTAHYAWAISSLYVTGYESYFGRRPDDVFTVNYRNFTGPPVHANDSYFGGMSTNELNGYYYFPTPTGRTFLVITLEHSPDALTWLWAVDIMDANPDLPTIIVTHGWMLPDGTIPTQPMTFNQHSSLDQAVPPHFIDLYLVRDHTFATRRQIFGIVCGHVGVENQKIVQNIWGDDVYYLLFDHLDINDGINALFNSIAFDEGAGTLTVETIDAEIDTVVNQVTMPLDMSRFDIP